MKHDKTDRKNKRELRHILNTELGKCADRLKELEKQQSAGDFSAETARKINLSRYHLEVTENRLNGDFTDDYRNELECKIFK